jgi:ABC-type polysaccharide/polyol phosphate transport system ATPase subunit
MIRLEHATLIERGRAVLDRVSFDFAPRIWHIAERQHGDARLLIELLAGQRRPATGTVRSAGARSWALAQVAGFGADLNGIDLIDMIVSLYALDRGDTVRLFRDLFPDAARLAQRFDRWPAALQRRFAHIAILAPAFDTYLLDVSPVLAEPDFYPRWGALFLARTAGKTVIVADNEHRAALRDFPGERLILADGTLRPAERTAATPPAMAAE